MATTTTTTAPPASPPTAADDVGSGNEDTTILIDVLANDSDPDGDTFSITGFDASSAAGGSVSCGGASCSYTPPADFNGTDLFSYTITDSTARTATATVTVSVTPVNDGPVARDDAASTSQDTALAGILVLINDSDPEGDARTVVAASGATPAGGTFSCGGSTCDYTPPAGFTGVDSFVYTITDPSGAADSATVTVTVNP